MKKIVYPGEFLATEEEYASANNTFEDAEGKIYSAVIGTPAFDNNTRTISVEQSGSASLKLVPGTIVLGQVMLVKPNNAVINVFYAQKDGKARLVSGVNAAIPISCSSSRFVKDISELFKIGDIVKAVVSKVTKYSIDLDTVDLEFGVVKAFCSKCRKEMQSVNNRAACICSSIETRKLSRDYGRFDFIKL